MDLNKKTKTITFNCHTSYQINCHLQLTGKNQTERTRQETHWLYRLLLKKKKTSYDIYGLINLISKAIPIKKSKGQLSIVTRAVTCSWQVRIAREAPAGGKYTGLGRGVELGGMQTRLPATCRIWTYMRSRQMIQGFAKRKLKVAYLKVKFLCESVISTSEYLRRVSQ